MYAFLKKKGKQEGKEKRKERKTGRKGKGGRGKKRGRGGSKKQKRKKNRENREKQEKRKKGERRKKDRRGSNSIFLSVIPIFYHLGNLCISSYEKLPKGKVTNSQESKSLWKRRKEI